MDFEKQLNIFIDELNCTSKELSEASGISTAVISRFRNGKKVPNLNSTQLEDLSNGLFQIANSKNIVISKENIYNSLINTIDDAIDMEQLRKNFNELISILDINITNLANYMGFSPSLISKIKSGHRTPSEPKVFSDGICRYVVDKFKTEEEKKSIALLLQCPLEDLTNELDYSKKLSQWLSSNSISTSNPVHEFLNNLDEFDLDQYIKSIHFDTLKVPHIPFYKPNSKSYFGINEMKQGELDFFKATVLSKSMEPIFMYSDMPMEDMAKDIDYGKKWMFVLALALKKGLHLNIIHNLNRPFNEMMLGLESWIPLYMTGQVSPYYLQNYQNNTFCHFCYVSGTVALSGECIKSYHNKGKYYLTNNKKELDYYKEKSNCLLKTAKPLMDIYKIENKNALSAFITSNSKTEGNRRRILTLLPIHTISEKLLLKILKRNNVSDNNIKNIINYVKTEKEITKSFLKENTLTDEIEELSEKEFSKNPQLLFLANIFYEDKIDYTYEEYLEHLNLTKKFADTTNNYKI